MKNIYWMTDDGNFIYEASIGDTQESTDGKQGYIVYSLELVCGKEYPTDDSRTMKWCSPDYFVEDVKYPGSIVQYFEEESMVEVFEDDGYVRWEGNLPKIYEWVEEE